MIVNSVICKAMLFVFSNAYPTIRCLEILRKTDDVYVIKKWLSFFVVCTIFKTLYYFIPTLFMFPVEIELFLLLFMIKSDAKGSFLLYERLEYVGLSDWTQPLENIANFLKNSDSEDIIRSLDRCCNSFYVKAFFGKQIEEKPKQIYVENETNEIVTEENETNKLVTEENETSIESSVQIVEHNKVLKELNENYKNCDELSEKCDETNKEIKECEVDKHISKKRTKKND